MFKKVGDQKVKKNEKESTIKNLKLSKDAQLTGIP